MPNGHVGGFTLLPPHLINRDREIITYVLVFFGFAFVFIYTEALKQVLQVIPYDSASFPGLGLSQFWTKQIFLVGACAFFGVHAWNSALVLHEYAQVNLHHDLTQILSYGWHKRYRFAAIAVSNVLCIIWPFYYLASKEIEGGQVIDYSGYITADIALLVVLVILGICLKR